ncbi:hypothetical protein SHM_08590 [Spiroplasma ixodetis]|uniref:Uncharacterized protein n=1 Tax=Spiroplasma ixodetis TaxID=2141 RepID=A0ABM8BTM3_9MOLU|nr:hypothetical protein SHM_08590 [Spiroplasma ixodetis]
MQFYLLALTSIIQRNIKEISKLEPEITPIQLNTWFWLNLIFLSNNMKYDVDILF